MYWNINNRSTSITLLSTACYDHITYGLQSESTLYSCPNVKESLAQNRRNISSLSDRNGFKPTTTTFKPSTIDPNWPFGLDG